MMRKTPRPWVAGDRRTTLLRVYLPGAMVLVSVCLYIGALRNPFMTDDVPVILTQPRVLSPAGLLELWTGGSGTGGEAGGETETTFRPVTTLTYNLNAAATGYNPWPPAFRIVNIVLLGVVAWLAARWMSFFVHPAAAWIAALLFLVHPGNGEAINHISGRAELLALAGVIGFCILQRRAVQEGGWSCRGAIGALLYAGLALGSAETGLVLVPLAFVQLLIPPLGDTLAPTQADPGDNVIVTEPRPATCRSAKVAVLSVVLMGVALGVYVAMRSAQVGWSGPTVAPARDLTQSPLVSMTLTQRLPAIASLAWTYLTQVVVPDCSFNRIPTAMPTWADTQAWLGAGTLGAGVLALGATILRRHWLCLALGLALAQFVVIGHVLMPAEVYAANRLGMALTLAATMVLALVVNGLTIHSTRQRATAVGLALMAAAAAAWPILLVNDHCSTVERQRLRDLSDQPGNPVALFLYGEALFARGQWSQALSFYEQALDHRPQSVQLRHKLAAAHTMLGNSPEAARQYEEILRLNPDDARATHALGELRPKPMP